MTAPRCPVCGGPVIRRGRRGPPPTYCKPACRYAAKDARRYEQVVQRDPATAALHVAVDQQRGGRR